MSTSDQIVGILPAVVAGGVALKFTEGFLGKPSKTGKTKKKARKGYPSTQYRPW